MNDIRVCNKLSAPHEGTSSPLHKLISSKTRLVEENQSFIAAELWSASWWGFDRSPVYSRQTIEQQKAVLQRCNEGLLSEAYFIEKSGLAYCAKMTLLAQSTDEAQLFALIGADEAKHLAWIEPFIPAEQKCLPAGHFLDFLSYVIENYPPALLVYLVQIILEGWGLDHYRRLASGCTSQHLSTILTSILKDEALHHKSGSVLFDCRTLSADTLSLLSDSIRTYTEMVRVGPQSALHAIDLVAGELSVADLENVLEALQHETETKRKLLLLKSLMLQPGLEKIVSELELQRCFEPMSVRQAAQVFVASR